MCLVLWNVLSNYFASSGVMLLSYSWSCFNVPLISLSVSSLMWQLSLVFMNFSCSFNASSRISFSGIFLPSTQNSFLTSCPFLTMSFWYFLGTIISPILNWPSSIFRLRFSLVFLIGSRHGTFENRLLLFSNLLTSIPWLTNQSLAVWPPFLAILSVFFSVILYLLAISDQLTVEFSRRFLSSCFKPSLSHVISEKLPECFFAFFSPFVILFKVTSVLSLAACFVSNERLSFSILQADNDCPVP